MAYPAPRQSAILYQNPENTIILLDIPQSISLAQGTLTQAVTRTIYSSSPLNEPYPSTEPKTETARANVVRIMGPSVAGFPGSLLREALEEVGKKYGGDWCMPRQISPFVPARRGVKRKIDQDQVVEHDDAVVEPSVQIPVLDSRRYNVQTRKPLAVHEKLVDSFPNAGDMAHQLIHNPHATPVTISIGSVPQTYRIPPGAAFYLANIDEQTTSDFSIAARSFFSTPTASAGPGQFSLIVLDPPWENSSVKRSGRYHTMRQNLDPMLVLNNTLSEHIAPGGLVACWITNKIHTRQWALEAFETWGINFEEEWAWLKTTAGGLPVSDLEGLWRKPYEILLLGRHADFTIGGVVETTPVPKTVRRRVIIAVPDIHSRKPCLKELMEQIMPNLAGNRTLEIFARNLTAGWWSWGNEAIKYNWEGYWQEAA